MSDSPVHQDPQALTGVQTKRADNEVEANAKAKRKSGRRRRRKRPRSWPVRILIWTIQLACLFYIGMLIAMIMMEERLVYPGAYFKESARSVVASPEIETVSYLSTDDVTISSRLLQRDGATEVVLFFHGNGVKAEWLDGWTRQLSDAFNANVLTAEYRGYRDGDDAVPLESSLIEDCFAARDFLMDRYELQPDQIIVYGRSLGGGCATAVASRDGAKALVLEKTFDRMVNVAADRYPYFPIRMMMKNRYDNVARLTVYEGPLTMIHGTSDRIVPIDYGRKLFDSYSGGPKEFIEVPNLGHNDPISDATLSDAAQRTLEMIKKQANQ